MSDLLDDAAATAERFVGPLGRRWRHVLAVAQRASELSEGMTEADREAVISAAWLHDIGYAPEIARTQFHPLDGARWLKTQGWPADVVGLVAHHSGARFEAAKRDMVEELATFPFRDSPLDDVMAAADLTTGPEGQRFTYDERLEEILARYPVESVVHQTWLVAGPVVRQAVMRAITRHADAQSATG